MKNVFKVEDFVKQFVAACALEQGEFFWVNAYNEYYPYSDDALVVQNGITIEKEEGGDSRGVLIDFGEEFNFRVPSAFKGEMSGFKDRVEMMRTMFGEDNGFALKLKKVTVLINSYETVGVNFEFTWKMNCVFGGNQPIVLSWKREDVEESNVNIDLYMNRLMLEVRISEILKTGRVENMADALERFENFLKNEEVENEN